MEKIVRMFFPSLPCSNIQEAKDPDDKGGLRRIWSTGRQIPEAS